MRALTIVLLTLLSASAAWAGQSDGIIWSGFYIGPQVGYGWGHTRFQFPFSAEPQGVKNDLDGAVGGGTIGYNFERGNWVFGAEADISASNINGARQTAFGIEATPCLTPGEGCHASLGWFGTLRGRVGYSIGQFLPYFTGGLAVGGLRGSVDEGACPGCSIHDTEAGWTLGGGLEYAMSGSWSLKAEYIHMDFGAPGISGGDNYAPTHTKNYEFDVVRGGLNYHF